MTNLLFASRNAHKTREFADLLGPDFLLRDLTSEQTVPKIAESGNSFEENATIKALVVSQMFPTTIVIADDSGLEVAALGGAPGIFSARYAGENASDQQNIEKLLRELQACSSRSDRSALWSDWTARFCCVLAAANGGRLAGVFKGEVTGRIIDSPRGENGFGYDPVFVPSGYAKTFAELGSKTKNRISHRARATDELRRFLRELPS